MKNIEIQFLGSGDAFGSGGRLQACILVKYGQFQFLIDCGATCLTAMKRYQVNPNDINLILISHLHGDHYGGIPFFVNGAQRAFKRTEPLTIIGPPGTKQILINSMDLMFPGSFSTKRNFSLNISEYFDCRPETAGGVNVVPYLNDHPQAGLSFALRIECDGKIIGYSGDTQWTDSLLDAAGGTDLFISEAYFYKKQVKGHMDYVTLMSHYEKIAAKRIILTHMSEDMLSKLDEVNCEYAEDGKIIML